MFIARRLSSSIQAVVPPPTTMAQLDPHGTFLSGPTLRHQRIRRSDAKRRLAGEIEAMRADLAEDLARVEDSLAHMLRRFPQLGGFAASIRGSAAITRDALRTPEDVPTNQGLRLRKARLTAALRTTLCCSAQIAGAQVDELEKGRMGWGE
jgi:hypothetical protein